ncbi:MAG: ATP-binding protein [Rhodobacteraceae bacterium]|nr:ATP-binding protein [Paracoccaceae bacterium]MYF45203.1 ATP-binding protein [Paracoccaceae bacterium]MYI91785.1 ATP-binding protein [Paracoccaceae bacterium]
MLDFKNINAFEKGQRESFESLLCVLANRERPNNGAQFQPNDGSGGDGGVEALWINSDGTKIGFQAKYFWSFGQSQLKQMDKSVEQAIATHTELKKYVFAIPFDPKPDRGPKTKGKSEWEKWENKVTEWKVSAAKKGMILEFELWTKTTLTEKLLREENLGLLRNWFQEEILNDSWFHSQISSALLKLDERFNPDDHVDLAIEDLFDTIVRGPNISKKIAFAFKKLGKFRIPEIKINVTDFAPIENAFKEAEKDWHDLMQLADSFTEELSDPWYVGKTLEYAYSLEDTVWELFEQYSVVEQDTLEESDKHKLNDIKGKLRNLASAINELTRILGNSYIATEQKRCAIIHGIAGVGKSHLLARVAEERVKEGLPTVLLLGEQFSNSPFWSQTGNLLGLIGRTSKEILGVLNAVGLRKKQRIILMFDAINDGARSQYWYREIPGILDELKNYSHVTAVFSCREEYLHYAIPNDLLETLPKYRLLGFSNSEEREQAAISYLDKSGIARPNTAWLAPEFSNPLFLKCTSEALASKGESEFPRGLQGISEMMALYFDSLSWRVETGSANAVNFSKSIKCAVNKVAEEMARKGNDFLEEAEAEDLIDNYFSGRTPPEGKSWLQVLCETSLFRLDPPPFHEEFDPLNPPPERVRFTFQRFQDHLMAKVLTKQVKPGHEAEAFSPDGPLSFLLKENHFDELLNYQFAGLVNALSITFPEELGVEFAMTLPDWDQIWENSRIVKEGFSESLKWRKVDAFPEQTQTLFNRLEKENIEIFGLLLEISMTVDHPYNALFLHNRLKQLSLPERDSKWTVWINQASRREHPQIERIISWAMALSDNPVDKRHLELASLILNWSFSSSYMTLRDSATKALTTIFLTNSNIYAFVAPLIHDCDDPYVIERLYAAAFGACCINSNSNRLALYSNLTYDLFFADENPPTGLMVRDYALGIIELAKEKGALNSKVCLGNCYHPFSSTPPSFGLNINEVEKIAKSTGGTEIFNSASGEWGDFGKYSIPGRVSNFLTTPLSEPMPLSRDAMKKLFYTNVIEPFPDRVEALKMYEDHLNYLIQYLAKIKKDGHDEDTKQLANQYTTELTQSLETLKRLFSPDEMKRFLAEYLSEEKVRGEYNSVDVDQCRLWITKRAYDFGWTADRFPRDRHLVSHSRIYTDHERIGKKYQRIALDEIQARMADNFWYLPEWHEVPTKYRYSHHDYRRNIEPTILSTKSRYGMPDGKMAVWITQPHVKLPDVREENLIQWPFLEDPTESFTSKLKRPDKKGKEWFLLYEYNSDRQEYSEPSANFHGIRLEEFRFIYCVFLKKGMSKEFVEYLNQKRDLNVDSFEPIGFTSSPYLLEAFWRDTWQSEKFGNHRGAALEGYEFAIPLTSYQWESHRDKTLPNGFTRILPQKWFADELGLKMGDSRSNSWANSNNHKVLLSICERENRSAVVINQETLLNYFNQFEVEPVWIMIAERNTWPHGNIRAYRRSEAVACKDEDNWSHYGWNHDESPKSK